MRPFQSEIEATTRQPKMAYTARTTVADSSGLPRQRPLNAIATHHRPRRHATQRANCPSSVIGMTFCGYHAARLLSRKFGSDLASMSVSVSSSWGSTVTVSRSSACEGRRPLYAMSSAIVAPRCADTGRLTIRLSSFRMRKKRRRPNSLLTTLVTASGSASRSVSVAAASA